MFSDWEINRLYLISSDFFTIFWTFGNQCMIQIMMDYKQIKSLTIFKTASNIPRTLITSVGIPFSQKQKLTIFSISIYNRDLCFSRVIFTYRILHILFTFHYMYVEKFVLEQAFAPCLLFLKIIESMLSKYLYNKTIFKICL